MVPLVIEVPPEVWRRTVITDEGWLTSKVWLTPAVNTSLLPVDEMKLAVTVPAPLIVAEVEADAGFVICIDPENVQDENV